MFVLLPCKQLFASDGDNHASTNDQQDGINAKNYNGKEAWKDIPRRRGPTGGAVGGGTGAVLAGVARGGAAREVPRESLRRELHRCCWKSAADGNSSAGWPVDRGRLPEPGHRAGNRGTREARCEQRREGTSQALAHYFLRGILHFDAGAHGDTCARRKQAECVAWKCTDAGAATDAGSSGRPSAETKHHGADRDFAGSAKRTRQGHCASRSVAASEGADLGRSAESKPAGPVWRPNTVSRISQDAWTISSIFRRAELRQSGLRPDAVAEISGSAEYRELEQGEQPLDTRASDSAGGFAVHRDAARQRRATKRKAAIDSGPNGP